MKHGEISRREFLRRLEAATAAAALSPLVLGERALADDEPRPVVSIVKRLEDDTGAAVEEAIDLLGGIEAATGDAESIMLKPNLVSPAVSDTTDPEVVRKLAELMLDAGQEVCIGEGSGAAGGFNADRNGVYYTRRPDILDPMQQYVFDTLGYTEMAEALGIPLVNLHTGDMVEVEVPGGGFVFDTLELHHTLTEIDLLVSVPRMKTHTLAQVTLGMKNVIGLYAGSVYGSVRRYVHELGAEVEASGTAVVIVDMVRANKMGLTVVDGLLAMEGNGPTMGSGARLVPMDLIIAGTTPLATDIVTAAIMGFALDEIPTFEWAARAGMTPTRLEDIEVRGQTVESVQRRFRRPTVYAWNQIRSSWATEEM